MQRENMLVINDVDAIINGRGKQSIDDQDDLENLKPGDRVELEVEAENNFDDDTNLDIEDVDLKISCADETDIDFDDRTEDFGDISTEDEETESINFDIEEDAEDNNIKCELSVDGTDENGARHGEHIGFDIEVERKSHDIQIEDFSAIPNIVSCQDRSLILSATIRNLGKSDEDEIVVELTSRELGIQERITDIDLDEDDVEEIRVTLQIPEDAEKGLKTIQMITFYDKTKTSDTALVQVENTCGARKTITIQEQQRSRGAGNVVIGVGQSSIEVEKGSFVSIPVRITNPEEFAQQFVISLINIEDFAEPASSKTIYLNPGQISTVFLNLKIKKDAPPRTQSATIAVKVNKRVLATETINVAIDGEETSSSPMNTTFLIFGNFFIIILMIFLIDKYLIRKWYVEELYS